MTRLKRMNQKDDDDNGKSFNKGNLRYRKIRWFSINGFWKNIGCLVSYPTFGIGGSRLWENEEEIKLIGKKRKRCSIRIRVYLYDVCLFYYLLSSVLF